MGVPFFFRWITRNFKECVSYLAPEQIDVLAIDMNGLIHPVCRDYFDTGIVSIKHAKEELPDIKGCYAKICDKINSLVMKIRPNVEIILCIDGVAGLAKQTQQRQRRYKAKLTPEGCISTEPNDGKTFDRNCISPGTEFMTGLVSYLEFYISYCISFNEAWRRCSVYFSDDLAPGEGEHKLLNRIKSIGSDLKFCIHGLDADLIMLALGTHLRKIFIYRENDGNTSFINIEILRDKLIGKLMWDIEADYNRLIDDFILICFIMGNDFIPHPPIFSIGNEALDKLLLVYRKFGKHLTTVERDVDYSLISKFMGECAEAEQDLFLELKYEGNYTDYVKKITLSHFPDIDIKDVCREYVNGMNFVLKYYFNGNPSWGWKYPWYYAPFLSQLAGFEYQSGKFELGRPDNVLSQLCFVLPASSFDLMPIEYRNLPIFFSQYFPLGPFLLEKEGPEWQWILLLPDVNDNEIRKISEKIFNEMKPERKVKWCRSNDRLFTGGNSTYYYKNESGVIKRCSAIRKVLR